MDKEQFIRIWGSMAELARDIGEGETTVREWFRRSSIPPRHDAKIMSAAKARGRDLTPVEMFQLRQELFAENQKGAA